VARYGLIILLMCTAKYFLGYKATWQIYHESIIHEKFQEASAVLPMTTQVHQALHGVGRLNKTMSMKINVAVIMLALMFVPIIAGSARAVENSRPMMVQIIRERTQDLEDGHFLLEISPCYYKYKTNTNDWVNTGLLIKADIAPNWEISFGSDFISYQSPDLGISDLYVGAKWKFFTQGNFAMAISGYVLFPIGSQAFREPGVEPTMTLHLSQKLDNWEFGFSIGSTYAADEQREPYYLDLELGVEADYTLDDKNSFSAFSYGYGPDQRIDGAARIVVGTSYTRTFTKHHSMTVMLMKGLAGRGMDWSGVLTYSYTF